MNDNSPAISVVRFGLVAAFAVGAVICHGSSPALTPTSSSNLALAIKLPDPLPFPSVAATPAELARLRAAWQTTGPAHEAVARRISEADDGLKRGVLFPPEGGHHNQWYQCDRVNCRSKRWIPNNTAAPSAGTSTPVSPTTTWSRAERTTL